MKILVACEESQAVTKELRRLGHEAYSCDLQPPSGGHPEWHIQGDCLPLLQADGVSFTTMDGTEHKAPKVWDMVVAHPPCTYLTCVATRHLSLRCNPAEKVVERMWKVVESAIFFMECINANAERVCVENPIGYMNRLYRRPDQIISPYFFAESTDDTENYQIKRTCFWLKNLPLLEKQNDLPQPPPAGITPRGKAIHWEETIHCSDAERAKIRSKTFPGVARAMAEQWAGQAKYKQKE